MSSTSKRWELTLSSKIEGSDKMRYSRVGIIFLDEVKGNLSIKIDQGIALIQTPGVYINGFLPKPYEGPARGYQEPEQPAPSRGYPDRRPPGTGGDNVPF